VQDSEIIGIATYGTLRFSNGATSTLIQRNYIRWDTDSNAGWGIVHRTNAGSEVQSSVIRNNVIDDVGGTTSRMIHSYTQHTDSVYKVYNNTLISDGGAKGCQIDNPATLKAWNNIFYEIDEAIDNNDSDDEIYNNCFYNSTTKDYDNNGSTVADNITSDPAISDDTMSSESASDADLTASSTAVIDEGKSSGDADLPSDDYNADNRDASLDMGAFEY
jgi:hypothetical protein